METLLEEILRTKKIVTPTGEVRDLHSEIAPKEGRFIQKLIRDYKPKQTLEIGLAFGISSLYICEALKENFHNRHIIIDPYQNSDNWKGVGLNNLKRAGYSEMIEFYEERSLAILPKFLEKGLKLDFALIDGSHMFENVMVDYYFIDQMLKVGGIVVFDDVTWPAVRKVCRFIMKNSHYKVIGLSETFPVGTSWKWKPINAFKNIFPGMAQNILKPELIKTDADIGINGSCVALQKESSDRDWSTFFDF